MAKLCKNKACMDLIARIDTTGQLVGFCPTCRVAGRAGAMWAFLLVLGAKIAYEIWIRLP